MRPLRTRAKRAFGAIRAALGSGPVRRRLLLVSDGREYTSEQQFAPLWRHQTRLRRELGLALRWLPLELALRRPLAALARFDAIGLKLSFRRPAAEVEAIVARFRAAGVKLIAFDGDDDAAVLWPALIEGCDHYVKKHLFADPDAYQARFVGKNNLTDHVARTAGRSFADDLIPASQPIDPTQAAKLHLGWNVALDDKIAALALTPPATPRSIDICSRAHVPPDSWIYPLRAPAVAALEGLAERWRVAVPHQRVSQAAYDREMRSARICVSPFGYGEICWRDCEAIMAGCLLVKPDMSHIRTAPDLFVAGETYIPVRWDYADLEEACAPFLADEEARRVIVRQAQARLCESLSADWFVARVGDMLDAFSVE